ncbi:MAG: acyl carrier protein [Selenomonas sp.]|nr:acyl carrier protein [Selenomonas sp.]
MKLLEMLQEIHPQFDYEKSEDFFEDGFLDSFDLTRLIAALEDGFDISIGGDELSSENFKNLEAIAGLLARHGVSEF